MTLACHCGHTAGMRGNPFPVKNETIGTVHCDEWLRANITGRKVLFLFENYCGVRRKIDSDEISVAAGIEGYLRAVFEKAASAEAGFIC